MDILEVNVKYMDDLSENGLSFMARHKSKEKVITTVGGDALFQIMLLESMSQLWEYYRQVSDRETTHEKLMAAINAKLQVIEKLDETKIWKE